MPDDLIYIPNHRERMLAAWLSQFATKPIARSLMIALAAAVQRMEDDLFGLAEGSRLEVAVGDALDQWGTLVGEDRGNLGDTIYRLFIFARVLANNSKGNVDTLIRVLQLTTAPSTVRHLNVYPAAMRLTVTRETPMDTEHLRRVGALMRLIKPGGVSMTLIEAIPGAYYGFDEDPDALGLDAGRLSRTF